MKRIRNRAKGTFVALYIILVMNALPVCQALEETSVETNDQDAGFEVAENPAQPDGDLNMAMPEATTEAAAQAATEVPWASGTAEIPPHYNMQAYDDFGVKARQPHLVVGGVWAFSEQDVPGASESARTVAFSTGSALRVKYDDLNPNVPYILTLTYATESWQARAQSLSAGDVVIHDKLSLPLGTAARYAFVVPAEAYANGTLDMNFTVLEGPNAVVSEASLWAPLPAPAVFHVTPWLSMDGTLGGRVLDMQWQPADGVNVTLNLADGVEATAVSDAQGEFVTTIDDVDMYAGDERIEVTVQGDDATASFTYTLHEWLFFEPTYAPLPATVAGIEKPVQLLDGPWQISRDGAPAVTARVPGELELQGFEPTDETVFTLTREGTLPASWQDNRIILLFEAVHGAAEYFMNGTKLGESDVLYTPIQFDCTDSARPGENNVLEVRLKTDTTILADRLAASSMYAHHNPGGIHRSVRAFALPQTHVADLDIRAMVADTFDAAALELDVQLAGPADGNLALRLTLLAPGGTAVGDSTVINDPKIGLPGVTLRHPVANPTLWSAEKPALYTFELELLADGDVLQSVRREVGFRHLAVRGDDFLVNGQPVKLFGVNRHETHPLTGRADTARWAEKDAELFKKANINYIRTSHYPPTREFLAACDRLGIYVECEAPFCWTHRWSDEDDPAVLYAFLEPTAAMHAWHQTHPSVVLWSLGNESGWHLDRPGIPHNYSRTNAWLQENDPTRLTIFNNSWANDNLECDIGCIHYPGPWSLDASVTNSADPRPVLIDEYLHVMCYNTEEYRVDPGIREEWAHGITRFGRSDGLSFWHPDSMHNAVRKSDRYLGIAIWASIDELFRTGAEGAVGYGPWGIIDGWRRKKPEWWHTKMMYSPVWMPERVVTYDPSSGLVTVPVENRWSFTNLSECEIGWTVSDASGDVEVACAPGDQVNMRISLPAGLEDGKTLVLDVAGPDGEDVVTWGLYLNAEPVEPVPTEFSGAPESNWSGDTLVITATDYTLSIDKNTGAVVGETMLLSLPTLHLTQVQRANRWQPALPPLMEFPDPATRRMESLVALEDAGALVIRINESYADFSGQMIWRLDAAGRSVVDFEYTYTGEAREIRELGLAFDLDASCGELSWRRRGIWGWYPGNHLTRLEGTASADDGRDYDIFVSDTTPDWPWNLDAIDLGSRDFRATRHGVCEASLVDGSGRGLGVKSNAEVNARACLTSNGVRWHLLQKEHADVVNPGDVISGQIAVELLSADRSREAVANSGELY